MNDFDRFNDQFRETTDERNERLRNGRHLRQIVSLRKLVVDLSEDLTDEGGDWSVDGLHDLRRRVANALLPAECPGWLKHYRDPSMVQS